MKTATTKRADTAKAKLKPITRGTDWLEVFTGTKDGTPYDMRLYEWDCHFKTEQGVEKPIAVKPKIVVEQDKIALIINDYDTEQLPVGVLFYNLLRTSPITGWDNGYTEAICEGTVLVKPGVTDYDD
ncbi:MAG: hypothetical protein KGV56_02470 [Gammaproteobacteria bacterium]|nr:hypothetical protein [Gammaproteobacteria bacterium]